MCLSLSNCKRSTSVVNRSSNGKVDITWNGHGDSVVLTGSFDNWTASVLMIRDDLDGLFKATIIHDPSVKLNFKFIVDGEWCCSDGYPTETDEDGNINNVIHP